MTARKILSKFDSGPKPFKKYRKIALTVGAVIAIVCHFVPPKYKVVCEAISAACRGGI